MAAAKQRAALNLLAETIFAADNFRFQPSFLRKLAVNDRDIDDAKDMGRTVPTIDIAVDQQVLVLHRAVLGPLLGPEVAQRLLNNELKVSDPSAALRLADLYATLHAAIFSELKAGKDVPLHPPEPAARVCLAGGGGHRAPGARPCRPMPARCCAPTRSRLRDEMAAVQKRPRTSPETRAHIAESLSLLDEALKAPMTRQI